MCDMERMLHWVHRWTMGLYLAQWSVTVLGACFVSFVPSHMPSFGPSNSFPIVAKGTKWEAFPCWHWNATMMDCFQMRDPTNQLLIHDVRLVSMYIRYDGMLFPGLQQFDAMHVMAGSLLFGMVYYASMFVMFCSLYKDFDKDLGWMPLHQLIVGVPVYTLGIVALVPREISLDISPHTWVSPEFASLIVPKEQLVQFAYEYSSHGMIGSWGMMYVLMIMVILTILTIWAEYTLRRRIQLARHRPPIRVIILPMLSRDLV